MKRNWTSCLVLIGLVDGQLADDSRIAAVDGLHNRTSERLARL